MLSIEQIYSIFQQYPKIITDSRTITDSGLFFALRGETFDGNRFAPKALQNGCKVAVVDNLSVIEDTIDDRYVVVDNVLNTLQQLARYHREQFHIPVIGITGTNGKTTTKELIATVLSKRYNVLYTQGNFNNHIGVPLTLLQMNAEHTIAVIEMGANHIGEIAELVEIVRPTHGIITNVGKAHLEGFGSLEGVIKAKGALYDYLRAHKGYVFRNISNKYLEAISGGTEEVLYGLNDDRVGVVGCIEKSDPFVTLAWNSHRFHSSPQVTPTHFIGAYNAENMMAAIAFGLFFEVPATEVSDAIKEYQPHNNRSQYIKTAHNEVIMDAYNANPSSMEAALKNFHDMKLDHKLLILGDMLELGTTCVAEHQTVIDYAKALGFQEAILVGDNFAQTNNNYIKLKNLAMLRLYIEEHEIVGKSILIKGSHGIGLDQIITAL